MAKTLRDEDLRLNIIINGDNGRKEMAALERKITDTNAKLESLYAKRKKLEQQGKTESASYRSVQAQIGKYNNELERSREKLAALQRQQSVNTMTLSEVRRHINNVQMQLNKTDPKTPLWAQLNAELKLSKQRLAELMAQSKATGGTVCTMAERMNRYIGLITAGFASMSFAISGINRARNTFNEYDESLNNMRKTTGMTAEEADRLSRMLAGIDTRTAQNELMGIARVAGKLGIAKDDLFGFVKAADILKISLGKDLGDDVEVTLGQIGKLVTVFHITDEFGIEQAMMKVGASINELGKRSTANEANIVNFMKRVAGVAATAKMSIADVAGLGAAVDASGIQIETAGTAISNVITGMFKRTREFAAVAGMEYKEFADLLDNDVNAALNRVLAGMSNTDRMENVVAALDSLHIQGARSVTVLSTLANNFNMVEEQERIANLAFEEGTSCLKEFNIMNESATAKMEKHKKAVVEQAVALGRQLTPAINVSLSASTWLIKAISALVNFGLKYRTVIIGLTATYIAYIVQKKLLVTWSKLQAFWSEANAIALGKEALALNGARKSTMLLCAAKNLLVGNLKAAGIAFKAFWASIGPLGWVVLVVGAVTTAWNALKNKIEQTTASTEAWQRINKKVDDELDGQRAKISTLTSVIHNNTLSVDARRAAIAKLRGIIPEYNASLSKEGALINENTTAIKNYLAALERKIRLQAAQEELEQAYREKRKLEREQRENEQKKTALTDEIMSSADRPDMGQESGTALVNAVRMGKLQYNISRTANKIAQQDALIKELEKEVGQGYETTLTVDVETSTGNADYSAGGSAEYGGSDGKWSLDKDAEYQRQRHALKQKYLAGEIATEKEYNKQLLALDISTIQRRLNQDLDSAEERAKIQNTLDDKLLQQKEQNNKWSLGSDEEYMAAQLELKNRYLNKEIQSEAEYDELAQQLEITTLQNRLDKNIEQGEERVKLEQQLADKLLSAKKRAAQRQAEVESILADAEANRIEQENRRYELQKQKFAGQSDILAALQKQHERKITQIQLDSANDRISRNNAQYQLHRKMLQNEQRMQLSLFSGNSQQRKELRKRQYQELAALDEEHLKSLVSHLQSLIDSGEIEDIHLDVSLLSDDELLELRNKLQDAIAQLQGLQGQSDIADKSFDNGATLLGLSKSQWDDLFNGNLDRWEEWATRVADVVKGVSDTVLQLWNSVDKRQTAIENKQLKTFEKNNNKKKNDLEKRLKAGLITEAQYRSEQENLDAEYDAFKEEMELKQAKRQKALNITQAIINTAVSVTKTFAQWGWPFGIAAAAVQAALGAAQIAMIASTPISAGAEEGGFQNVTRAQDGRNFKARLNPDKRGFIDNPTLLVAENGTEYVIPNAGLQNPTLMPLISTIETARRNGTLRSLNFESVYPAISAIGRVDGGLTAVQNGSDISVARMGSTSSAHLEELFNRLLERLDDPIHAYVTMLGKNGIVEMMNKYELYKKRGALK